MLQVAKGRLVLLLVLLLLFGAERSGSASGSGSPGPPERIAATTGTPLWISASRARKADGALDWDRFSPFDRSLLEHRISAMQRKRAAGRLGSPSDPCAGSGPVFADYFVPHPTVVDLARYSNVIFSGEIRGSTEGFFRGTPVRLFEVALERVYKDVNDSLRGRAAAYVAYPDAAFSAGGIWFCARGFRFPERPVPGQRLLVFSFREPHGTEPVVSPMDEEIVFETEEDLSVPRHWDPASYASLDEIESQVERILASNEVGR